MAYIGIDTSNYTSSCALASDGEIIIDNRRLLKVKEGQLGLRQSDALYQHWQNLPVLLEDLFKAVHDRKLGIDGIVVSTKPRPQEGSYMPVFNAGAAIGKVLSDSMSVPLIERSHQEGHILAAAYGNDINFNDRLVCAHLSGGTLELVSVNNHGINICGGTCDISYGQLIDRTGVMLGMQFPAGKELDRIACTANCAGKKNPFKRININDTDINLSGTETQVKKAILSNQYSAEEIAYFLMKTISDSFISIIQKTGAGQILVTGGVASSAFLRRECESYGFKFGRPDLCSDNAVGLALSEGKLPW